MLGIIFQQYPDIQQSLKRKNMQNQGKLLTVLMLLGMVCTAIRSSKTLFYRQPRKSKEQPTISQQEIQPKSYSGVQESNPVLTGVVNQILDLKRKGFANSQAAIWLGVLEYNTLLIEAEPIYMQYFGGIPSSLEWLEKGYDNMVILGIPVICEQFNTTTAIH